MFAGHVCRLLQLRLLNRLVALASAMLLVSATSVTPAAAEVQSNASAEVFPPEVHLQGNFARAQMVVRQADPSAPAASGRITERSADWTRRAEYRSSAPAVVTVDETGRLLAQGNGQAEIAVTVGPTVVRVPVTVSGVTPQPQVGFMEDIRPIVSKAGCNMGACHAAQYGQAGFKLSVFGYQPAEDREAMVRDRQQRRVNFLQPEKSLLLKKPTMQIPHGGSLRVKKGSADYQILAAWIRNGAPAPNPKAPKVTGLTVTPKRRLGPVHMTQQLRVEATYSDGSTRDVTSWAKFDSMDEALLGVDDDGLVTVLAKGQATIMARFEGQAEVATFVVPYAENVRLADWKNNNYVDELAAAKFRELGIEPSPLCDDAAFLRRAFLDATGSTPTVDETVAFLNSDDPQKREHLVDRLLGLTGDPEQDIYNDRYAAWWTLKWSDLIRNSSDGGGNEQGMWALYNWIKEAFRENQPFDRFVRELVTAQGSIFMNGPANYYQINRNASDLTESTAQLFLGIRLQCAKCHHHPFEKYSQEDYQGFSRFFSRVGTKSSQEFGLFGRESVVIVRPTNGATAKPLDEKPVSDPLDLRIPLAKWLTSPKNDYFARSIANRYVGYLLGRGLVEPIDDMRQTNPATNPELLDALAKDFINSGFDLKHLVRTIMTSRLYQLDSQPTPSNASDRRFFSHYLVKRLPAEALLDAVDAATGVPTKFQNLPLGTRAIELPDAEYPNYFLQTFGKPKRASVCECERSPDENLAQALHTLNGTVVSGKVADQNGRVAKLLAAKKPHEEIVMELYLATLCRPPTDQELALSRTFLDQAPDAKQCYEDLQWALINSKQFLFVR